MVSDTVPVVYRAASVYEESPTTMFPCTTMNWRPRAGCSAAPPARMAVTVYTPAVVALIVNGPVPPEAVNATVIAAPPASGVAVAVKSRGRISEAAMLRPLFSRARPMSTTSHAAPKPATTLAFTAARANVYSAAVSSAVIRETTTVYRTVANVTGSTTSTMTVVAPVGRLSTLREIPLSTPGLTGVTMAPAGCTAVTLELGSRGMKERSIDDCPAWIRAV
mmetsp:Transcript_56640/g.179018  ORF Transcript_56640/g.179018 Transcript_56640/m.179018 type:complete len:221 (+) Transcript_56640:651-1313(+)